ncbi:hypothetical protein SDC9_164767 [bioreactor metagenome]|uniref:Uncharacterized protein n=1 Tax=bioreactor metagenome TaxID=1076179 RepID=A0A645FZX0_9ZZZZ
MIGAQLAAAGAVLTRRRGADQVERASLEAVVDAGQGTDRADLDDIAREVALVGMTRVDVDLAQRAPLRQRDEVVAADLFTEARAALAQHAALPVDEDLRRDVHRLRVGALEALEPRFARTMTHRLVLQGAFAALVADRAVQRVVDQQELQHALLVFGDLLVGGGGLDDHVRHHGQRTGRLRLHRTPIASVGHLDQALPAGGDRIEQFVIAEPRDVDA